MKDEAGADQAEHAQHAGEEGVGRWRESTVTATVHSDSDIAHSSSEPSWCPTRR